MASIIKLKRSTTQGSIPSGGDLQQAELAVNLADKVLFTSTDGSDVVRLSGDLYNLVSTGSSDSATITLTVDNETLSNDSITFTASEGIDISESSGTITIAGELASDTNKGVASFDNGDFVVTTGVVTLADSASGAVLTINGTSNEIEVSRSNGTVTIGLPDDVTVTTDLSVGQDLDVTRNTTIGGTLGVDGATSLHGLTATTITANSTVDAKASLNVDGNTTLNGLTATTITANGAVTVKGATDLESTLNVDGATTLNGVTATTVQANSTLDVTGLSSLDGGVDVNGKATIASATGNIDTDGTLNVDGATTLNGLTAVAITANGAIDAKSTLNVDGNTTLNGVTASTLTANGNVQVGGDLTVDGDLTVEGALTYISSSTVNVDDSAIKLGANNTADSIDIGMYGMYVDGATQKYSGWFRDASDSGVIKWYKDTETEPGQTVNTGATGYTLAQIDAIIDGGTY